MWIRPPSRSYRDVVDRGWGEAGEGWGSGPAGDAVRPVIVVMAPDRMQQVSGVSLEDDQETPGVICPSPTSPCRECGTRPGLSTQVASTCSRRMSACPQWWASSRRTCRYTQRSVRGPARWPVTTASNG